MSKEKQTCAFCGAEISRGEGKTPMPIIDNDLDAVCCSKCNKRFIIPARERLVRALNEEREKILEIVTKERKNK